VKSLPGPRRHVVQALLVTAGLALAAAGCGSSNDTSSDSGGSGSASTPAAASASTVKVGVITDLTGPTASTQVPYNDGVKAYFDSYNKALKSGQHKIDASYADDKFDTALGLAAYKKAVSDGDVATIGPNSSATQPAVVKLGMTVPLISGVSTTITDQKFLWNLLPKFTDQAAIMVNYAKQKSSGPLNAAALILDVPSGQAFAAALKTETEKAGGKYLGTVAIDPADAGGDWRSQAQKLAELKPNFVGFLGSAADPQTFLPAFNNAGLSDVTVGAVTPESLYKENWTKVPKSLGSKFFTISSITPADAAGAAAPAIIAAATTAGKPEDANNVYFVQGYVAAKLTADAINKTGASPTADTVNTAIAGMNNYDSGGLNPPLCFGPDDHYGTASARPLYFDLSTQKFTVAGDFADWAKFVNSPDGTC
jgi:branched-chain amino acid transport system substrate-binding protein